MYPYICSSQNTVINFICAQPRTACTSMSKRQPSPLPLVPEEASPMKRGRQEEEDIAEIPFACLQRELSVRQMSDALVFAAAPATKDADPVFLDAKRREHARNLRKVCVCDPSACVRQWNALSACMLVCVSQAYEDAFNHNQDPISFLVEVGRQLKAGMSAEWKVSNMSRVKSVVVGSLV